MKGNSCSGNYTTQAENLKYDQPALLWNSLLARRYYLSYQAFDSFKVLAPIIAPEGIASN